MPFFILFALCWSGGILLGDCSIGHDYYKQFESGNFPSVTGTITYSEVQTYTGSKGNIYYNAVINYQYSVGKKVFVGDRLAFGEDQTARLADAATIVNAHPVGSTVQVYYDPTNPNESVLYPGLTYADFGWVLGLTPFNMIALGFWTYISGWLRLRFSKPVAGGVKIITDGMMTRVHLPRWGAIWWALVTTGVLGFISILVITMGHKFGSSIKLTWPCIFTTYIAGIGVYAWRCWKASSGGEDLIINEASGTLELPLTFGRKERIVVRFRDIEFLSVETIVHSGPKGTSYAFAPTIKTHGNDAQKLVEWSDKYKADLFTEWLNTNFLQK